VKVLQGFCGAVGNTPLIRLRSLSELTGCEILGKAEFLNPGGSVKDRAALGMVQDAEVRGLLKPGGILIEGTAGNTGVGLTLVGNTRGYRTILVVPETQSPEKISLLRAMGADVRTVPAAPYSDSGNYNHVARHLAESLPGAVWVNQFDNPANRDFHTRTTGPEIWDQTEGKVSAFVAAVGTGGTLAGTSIFLKQKNPKIATICADPHGASIWSWIKLGHLDFDEGDSITEGIGQGRITKNLEGAPIDDAYRIGDGVILEMVHYLARHEGLFLGSSAAINVCGAVKRALDKGPGQTIVTILCDGGARYQSRLYNPEWLSERGLLPKSHGLEFLDALRAEQPE
jgi:cysteine synthase A